MHDPLHFEVIPAVLLVEYNIVKVRVYIFFNDPLLSNFEKNKSQIVL